MGNVMRWLRKVWLLPLFVLMGIPDGDAGGGDGRADGGGDGGTLLGGGSDGGGNNDGGGDLSGLFTPEEITAKKEAVAAAKSEEERRAALTDEERAAEDARKAEEEAKSKAPEEYADFTLPEGMEVDKDLLAEFLPIAKELKLTQDQAQKLVDIEAKMVAKRMDAWNTVVQGWSEATKTDKEIGGDNFDKNVEVAQRALNTFGTPELKTALNQYGLGNHPELIRLMVRIGNAMREDGIVLPGGQPSGNKGEPGRADRLYGNTK